MRLSVGKKSISRILVFIVVVSFFSFGDYSSFVYPIKLVTTILLLLISRRINTNSYFCWIILFLSFSLTSCFWAIDVPRVLIYLVWTAQAMLIAFSVGLTIRDEEDMEYVYKCILIGGIILCVRALSGVPFDKFGTFRLGKSIGYNENELALKAAIGGLTAFYYFCKSKVARIKVVLLVVFVLHATVVAFTGSRKGVLMILVTIILFLLFNSNNPLRFLINVAIGLLGISCFYFAINNIEILYNSFGRRFMLLFNLFEEGAYVGNSMGNRLEDIEVGLKVFEKSPIWGYGLGNYEFATQLNGYAHNNYIQLLVDLGLIGICIYYYFYMNIAIKLIKTLHTYRIQTALCLSMLGAIVVIESGLVSFNSDYVQLVIMLCFYRSVFNRRLITNSVT